MPSDRKEDALSNGSKSKKWLLSGSSFWLTRIFFLRSLALVYFTAFLVAYNQNTALLGPRGLLPIDAYMKRLEDHAGADASVVDKIFTAPTLLWFTNYTSSANLITTLDLLAVFGLLLSGWILYYGAANMIMMFSLWVLYHSIVNVGQRWYSFGWESQLLETGFLAIFLCPLFDMGAVPKHLPTPYACVLLYRWLIFRIMLGAGLIKIRGDECWRDLTCMHYHYETQPVPNPFSIYFHHLPGWWHMFEVASNHFVELLAPFFMLALPFRRVVIFGGIVQILFQVVLIISGNLSFLNWLTILPAIFCLDDRFLRCIFSSKTVHRVQSAEIELTYGSSLRSFCNKLISYLYNIVHWGIFLLIAYLSIPVVQNLLSSRQVMNTSFDSFRLVNTYGAFGSVTKQRTEVIFQGTRAADPNDPNTVWLEYEFPCKPGNVTRRPCLISPYHYRLDWLLWFAAFENYQYNPWLIHLAGKMLDNDIDVLSHIVASNPFEDGSPPSWVRVRHYSYSYAKYGSSAWVEKKWWVRKDIGTYLQPVSKNMLTQIYNQFGWRN